jgi:hypothetical protein
LDLLFSGDEPIVIQEETQPSMAGSRVPRGSARLPNALSRSARGVVDTNRPRGRYHRPSKLEGFEGLLMKLIVGDIHGCYAEFEELLQRAGVSADDEVIALGDIVDRGPDSPRVLDFFRTRTGTRSLMGNHERKHVRSFRGEIKPALSQIITRGQFGEAYPDAIEFMKCFPYLLELPEAILVHGYLEPGVPLAGQRETVLCGTQSGEHYLSTQYDRPWYELYEGAKPVIVGHHDYLGTGKPFIYQDRVFALDTGCYCGRALTALTLPGFRLLSVRSGKDYWRDAREVYRKSLVGHPDEESGRRAREEALGKLLDCILEQKNRILDGLRRETPGFDELPPQDQGRAYGAVVGNTRLAGFLHQARLGKLTLEVLRRRLRKPEEIDALAKEFDLQRRAEGGA